MATFRWQTQSIGGNILKCVYHYYGPRREIKTDNGRCKREEVGLLSPVSMPMRWPSSTSCLLKGECKWGNRREKANQTQPNQTDPKNPNPKMKKQTKPIRCVYVTRCGASASAAKRDPFMYTEINDIKCIRSLPFQPQFWLLAPAPPPASCCCNCGCLGAPLLVCQDSIALNATQISRQGKRRRPQDSMWGKKVTRESQKMVEGKLGNEKMDNNREIIMEKCTNTKNM